MVEMRVIDGPVKTLRRQSFPACVFCGGPIVGQMTVFGLGHLVLKVVSGMLPQPTNSLWAAQQMRLRVLWPGHDPLLHLPPPGWSAHRASHAGQAFTELIQSEGPKRFLFLGYSNNIVRHDSELLDRRPLSITPLPVQNLSPKTRGGNSPD